MKYYIITYQNGDKMLFCAEGFNYATSMFVRCTRRIRLSGAHHDSRFPAKPLNPQEYGTIQSIEQINFIDYSFITDAVEELHKNSALIRTRLQNLKSL